MVETNYDKILNRIAKASGLTKEEVDRKVEAKVAKLAGLISKEGAAQVVSSELGINFDNEKFKIDELLPGMRKVNVVGKVINLFPVRTFERQGKTNKVANFVIADETSNIKIVLWDTNHIELIETGKIEEGTVVEIGGGSMRDNEIHLGSFSELKVSKETLGEVKTERVVKEKPISEFKPMDNVKSRAYIVQAFDPRFFHVCSECKKKATLEGDKYVCKEHGSVAPEKRALINIVLDDGTESIRAVLFHENLTSIGLNDLEDAEKLANQKQDLLGKEMVFSGNVRMNRFFNNPEFIVNSAQEVNLDELLNKLENKA
jgi:ssDNA-binding replication factor A large subunit